jgi:hypothetical protein
VIAVPPYSTQLLPPLPEYTCMSRGASLLETLTVLAITTSLLGSVVAGAATTRRALMLRLESDRLRLLLERAYTLALTSDSAARVVVEGNLVEGTAVSLVRGDERLTSYRTNRSITLELPSHLGGALRFYPSHAASPATINLRASKDSCAITISLRGRIRTTC